jgi:hypothetical protein
VSPRHGQARTGEIKRTATGWAIRYRDAHGYRRQRGGFRTKAEAKTVLDDELRKARLGVLYRPDATLQQLVDTFLEQYEGAPSSKDRLDQYLGKATARFGDQPIGSLDALAIARWRGSLPETMRHGAHRALRQVLRAAVRWRWIEHNVASDVTNPQHPREVQPVRLLGGGRGRRGRARAVRSARDLLCRHRRAARGGFRRRLDRHRPRGRDVHSAAGVCQGPAEAVSQDRAVAAASAIASEGARRAPPAAAAGRRLVPCRGGRADQHRQLPLARVGSRVPDGRR